MDTNVSVALPSRQRRRHAPEFKARVIAACLQPGVSLAAVALANGLNANLLRTWVKAYRNQQQAAAVVPAIKNGRGGVSAATLVPVAVQRSNTDSHGNIELEIRRQQTVFQIRWPASEATACAQWLRDLLR